MQADDQLRRLLEEIRDIQREHLAEYKRVTQQSLDLQQRAVKRQEQVGKLYQRVIAVTAPILLGMIALVVYLLFLLRRW